MKKKKIKNPLIRRIPRELTGDWKKYLVVSLFLILMIGFVSCMYVANESMMTAADEGVGRYKLEDGHFELKKKADETLLDAIKTGDKADVRQYYIDEAKKKLDKKFDSEFEEKFKKEFDEKFETEFREKFDAEFQSEFDVSFNAQIKQMLMAQGLDETTAGVMLDTAVAQAKQSGQYNKAYDTAYEKAYPKAHDEAYEKAFDEAHDEAYEKAYDEAWNKVLDEINEKYADAEEKYELNDPDFKETPVHLYENFYRDEEEDHDNDGTSDGTVRVFAKTDDINFACLMDGSFPEKEDEIAIDRMHADNVGIKVGEFPTNEKAPVSQGTKSPERREPVISVTGHPWYHSLCCAISTAALHDRPFRANRCPYNGGLPSGPTVCFSPAAQGPVTETLCTALHHPAALCTQKKIVFSPSTHLRFVQSGLILAKPAAPVKQFFSQ